MVKTGFGNFDKEIEAEIEKNGYHILNKSKAKIKGNYPNEFPLYKEIENVKVGEVYAIRAFVKNKRDGIERVDSGLIDVHIMSIDERDFTAAILTLLPPNFPIAKGQKIKVTDDQLLFKQNYK